MRSRTPCWWISLPAATLLGSCAEPVQAAPAEDTLVLEVGGGQASLREALRAMGREVGPPRRLRPDPQGPSRRASPRAAPVVERPRAPAPGEGERVEPQPSAPVEALDDWVWVELLKDETLSHASYRLLGTSRRYREIMAWNGIQEDDLRRLRPGFRFKVKRAEMK